MTAAGPEAHAAIPAIPAIVEVLLADVFDHRAGRHPRCCTATVWPALDGAGFGEQGHLLLADKFW